MLSETTKRVVEMKAQGASMAAICTVVGLTPSQVYGHLGRWKSEQGRADKQAEADRSRAGAALAALSAVKEALDRRASAPGVDAPRVLRALDHARLRLREAHAYFAGYDVAMWAKGDDGRAKAAKDLSQMYFEAAREVAEAAEHVRSIIYPIKSEKAE